MKDANSAMTFLEKAMHDDYSYAWAWYNNVVMAMIDAGCGDVEMVQDGAARFMKTCFGVVITDHPEPDNKTEEKTKEVTESRPPFMQALEELINRYSLETDSDTPDFILADYLANCLTEFADITKARDEWHGFIPFSFISLEPKESGLI